MRIVGLRVHADGLLRWTISKRAIQHVVPEVVLTVDALGVDLQEHFDAMAGPLRYLSGGHPGVEAQGNARVTQIVRPLGELGSDLR
jgi:hypothetical protein